jgi:hypothetical protein
MRMTETFRQESLHHEFVGLLRILRVGLQTALKHNYEVEARPTHEPDVKGYFKDPEQLPAKLAIAKSAYGEISKASQCTFELIESLYEGIEDTKRIEADGRHYFEGPRDQPLGCAFVSSLRREMITHMNRIMVQTAQLQSVVTWTIENIELIQVCPVDDCGDDDDVQILATTHGEQDVRKVGAKTKAGKDGHQAQQRRAKESD